MSRLSGREQEGCRKLLGFLPCSDLMALCDTVTNESNPLRNAEEAMDAILTHSQSAEELLKRRKVYREVIFKYLIREGIDMSREPDKNQLVERTLQFWASNSRSNQQQWRETTIQPLANEVQQSHQPGGSTDVPMARGSTTRRGIQYRRDRRQDRRHLRHHGPSLQPNQNQQYQYRQGGHFRQGQQQDLQRETVNRTSGTPESSRVFRMNETITIGRTFRIEAMDAILTYSKSAEELLKRRKVYREVIFKYLISEGIAMPPDADKNQLARRALLFWVLNSTVKSNKASYVSTPADEEMDFSSAGEEISACDYMALGKQFCQWYYNLVNTQNPTLGQEPLDWGPQHFWEDAWLMLCYSAEVQKIDRFQGAELVSQNLLALIRNERLFFSPNLEPHGLKCEATPHGLVMAAVAGTIHRERACLGIFEQAFGLIRSPLDANSWKIKFTHLRMRGQNELTGGETMTSPAVTYSSDELLSLCERGFYF